MIKVIKITDEIYNNIIARELTNENDWIYVSTFIELSEKLIDEFKNKVDWRRIAKYQKLSTDFIEKHFICYSNSVDDIWAMCFYQKLTEEFIVIHQDSFDKDCWNAVFNKQDVSKEFVKQHYNEYIDYQYEY